MSRTSLSITIAATLLLTSAAGTAVAAGAAEPTPTPTFTFHPPTPTKKPAKKPTKKPAKKPSKKPVAAPATEPNPPATGTTPASPTPQTPARHATSWPATLPAGTRGIDVSSWQHPNNQPINWQNVKTAGVQWVYAKCSDGAGPGKYSTWGPQDVRDAETVGIAAGCYHYAQPGKTSPNLHDDALTQARNAHTSTPPQATLRPVLDMEETAGHTADELSTWASDYLTEMTRLSGHTAGLYASNSYLNEHLHTTDTLNRTPVWVAAYTRTPTTVPTVPDWVTKLVAWQFSDSGHVNGINDTGVDLNIGFEPHPGTTPPPPQPTPPVTPPPAPPATTQPSPHPPASVSPTTDTEHASEPTTDEQRDCDPRRGNITNPYLPTHVTELLTHLLGDNCGTDTAAE